MVRKSSSKKEKTTNNEQSNVIGLGFCGGGAGSNTSVADIKNGDIVKIYNERGTVLGGAYVNERMIEGAVQMDHGARYDPIIPGELDRGGVINTITPRKTTSKNATGMVVSSFLVEVEKVTMAQMEEWKKKYPDAFERKYDAAAGLRFDAHVITK